jgi:subtilase family serine protease
LRGLSKNIKTGDKLEVYGEYFHTCGPLQYVGHIIAFKSEHVKPGKDYYIKKIEKPDLIIQDISWSPSNPKQGDTVTINVKTKNIGSGKTGGFYVCYYVDGSYYDRDYVSSLSAGSTTTTSFTWTADCGSHSIKAVADCYDAVTESNEGNNARTEYINIVCKPDLVVQGIFWSPSNPRQGDTVTVNVKTKNQGSESVGGFYVCYYVDGSYYARDYVSSLSAGSTTTTSFSWTAECGNHAIKAVADCYDAVAESDEENNWRSKGGLNIPCKPDLIVQDIFWSPSSPKMGETVTINIITKNQGSGNTGGFYVCYYVDSSYYARDYVSSLSAGSTTTTSFSWTAECGNHAIKAVADCYNAITESDETNNARTEYINIIAEWSFMVYMDADNDIEWMAVSSGPKGDFLEMSEIGSTEDLNVVVQLDRHGGKDWCYDFGDWTTCKRFKITKNLKPDSEADFNEEVNMGHPNTLYDFITWVKKDYSAQHYCLVLWDHGSGWEGCCKDNTSNDDKLTLQEIKQAFKQAGIKFDVLVFDACIMGNIETVYQLNDYTNTVIASEDVGGHRMSPYDAILQELTKKPNMGWDELGRIWVDEYYKFYKLNYPKYDFSVSKVDTKHIVLLKDSVDTLAKKLIQYWPSYRKEISAARNNAEKYAKSTNHEDEYVDIYDFSQLIKESDVPNDLKNAAGNVIDLINHCVYSKNISSHPNSKGLSIYFPLKGSAKYKDEYDQLDFAKDTKWDDWLKIYLKENQLPDLEKIWITGPAEVKAGETLQWQAYGSYSDGSQKELTNQASWTIDHSDILQNIGNGKFKGLKGGEATLKITYEGKSASKKVTVKGEENQPPKASFTYEKDGLTVRFTSTSADPDGDIETYSWFFRDGGISNQKNPIHTYSSEGTYTVVLLVRDDKGAVDAYNEDVTVTEKPKEKGTLVVNVYSIDGKPTAEVKGTTTIELIKSGDVSPTAKQNINDKSRVTFNDIPAGDYYINVYHNPQLEQGSKEFWGQRKDIAITAGTTTTIDFYRYNPYVDKFYAEKNSVEVNTPVKINVGIKVPSNCPGADAYVKALVIIRDENGHEVYRKESDDRKVQKGGSITFSFSYTPTKEGTYYGLAKAYIVGGGELCTDNCGWMKVFTCQKEESDLVIQDIAWKPKNPESGDPVDFTITVKNTGTKDVDSAIYVDFETGATQQPRKKVADSLKSGETATVTYNNILKKYCLSYLAQATVDPDNTIVESDENNNYKVETVDIAMKYALIVGINNYDDKEISQLDTAVRYANKMKKLLISGYNYDEVKLLTEEDATKHTIGEYLTQFSEKVDLNDIFVFYFFGHGTNNTYHKEGIVAHDLHRLSDEDFVEISNNFKGTVICIFESCNSGGMAYDTDNSNGKTGIDRDNAIVLMSCQANEDSYENKIRFFPWLSDAIYPKYLYEAFVNKRQDAEKNNDGKIALEEAHNYAWKKTIAFTDSHGKSQHPQIMDHYKSKSHPEAYCYFSRHPINPEFINE